MRDNVSRKLLALGTNVYGAAAVLLGIVGLVWGDFIQVWQPFPEHAPGRAPLAYFTAFILLGAGLALQTGRARRNAGALLAGLYLLFALLWFQRVVAHPSIFAMWAGVAEQVATAIGGMLIYLHGTGDERLGRVKTGARISFGICAIAFGFNHFMNVPETAAMVPGWVPPSRLFWAITTGAIHAGAGAAIAMNLKARVAAVVLTVMYALFELFVWLPIVFASPKDHVALAGNGVNLALVGAAWVIAGALDRKGVA